MPDFEITTALTAYTRYSVRARDLDAARWMVSDNTTRATLADDASEAGYGDDEHVIAAKRVDDLAELEIEA